MQPVYRTVRSASQAYLGLVRNSIGRPSGRRANELLGIVLEHLVDFVEKVVELGLDLLALLRSRRRPPRRPPRCGPAPASSSALALPWSRASDLPRSPAAPSSSAGLVHPSNNAIDVGRGSPERLHHRHPPQRIATEVEHQGVPVGRRDRPMPTSAGTCPGSRPGWCVGGSVMASTTSSSVTSRSMPQPGEQRPGRAGGRGTAGPWRPAGGRPSPGRGGRGRPSISWYLATQSSWSASDIGSVSRPVSTRLPAPQDLGADLLARRPRGPGPRRTSWPGRGAPTGSRAR